jgi:hypothetical protein
MKKHFLPALISLTLLSPLVMAEHADHMPPPAPAMEMSGMTGMTGEDAYEAMMKKRMENRKEMQALWQKIQEAKTPEERQKFMEEQQKLMQAHHEAMRKDMDDMMPPPPYGYGRPERMRPMGKPPMGYGYDDGEMPPPPMNMGRHNMNGGRGGCHSMDRMAMDDMDMPPPPPPRAGGFPPPDFMKHRDAMEKRMENVEKLLEKIADALTKQAK